ncbi:hypothetical protein KCN56_01180 [Photobacterium galatheae]|uniref:hypothetical protein n=1 Tax=Photobacterium galatheae TaxID=1654360 RepID=UPI00202D0709|nr:hypothetical protein [Photobacterium galatheae]MCM0147180.1 hypothetical protein [Photobacterium galatheae]
MIAGMEKTYCKGCCREEHHVVVLVRKPTGFEKSSNRKLKEFIAGFIIGWAVGPFLASMDAFSRHLVCEVCGTKIIED